VAAALLAGVLAHGGGSHSRWQWSTVLGVWDLDALSIALLAGGLGAYLAGVRRLRRAGRTWPVARTGAMVAATATLAAALLSGLAHYEDTLFSAHAAQHLMVGMIAPLLVVLAAPLTLAMHAAPPGHRRHLHRLTHHPGIRTLAHPVAGLALFAATLVALYFTPLYELSLRNDAVHVWLHLHLFVAGALLVWPLVGAEPMPVRTSHLARLLAVMVAVPFHAFVAVALMTAKRPLAIEWYQDRTGRAPSEILADQRLGAGLLWAAGELLSVVVIGIVVMRWVEREQRVAERAEALQPAGGSP
jgi:putative copper resistance protein D